MQRGDVSDAIRQLMADQANDVAPFVAKSGRATAIAGSKAKIDILHDDTTSPLENEAGIWPGGPVFIKHGLNNVFTASDGSGAGAPSATAFVRAENNGSLGDICAGIFVAVATQSTGAVYGLNVIARNTATDGGASKMVGVEIDWEDADASAESSNSGALFINSFSSACPVGLLFGGVSGGSFTNGIGFIANISGSAIYASTATLGSLTNTGSATYSVAAHVISNGHKIRFGGTAAAHGFQYMDGANNLRLVMGSAGFSVRNNGDTATMIAVTESGSDAIVNLGTAAAQLQVNGTKVVGPRQTGTAANASDLATAITLVNDLKAKLVAHGLIS